MQSINYPNNLIKTSNMAIDISQVGDKMISVNGEAPLPAIFVAFYDKEKDQIILVSDKAYFSLVFSGKIGEITINGTPQSSIEDCLKTLNSFVGNFLKGGASPSPTVPKAIRVRFISPEPLLNGDYIIATQYYDKGENIASFPTPPEFSGLTFQAWTHTTDELSSLQHDIDVGGVYIPTDGKTHTFIELTSISGLAPALYLTILGTATLRINWGDGSTQDVSVSGNWTHTYTSVGKFEITIERISGDGTYSFGGGSTSTSFFGGGTTTYRTCLTKIWIGSYVEGINTYAFIYASRLRSIVIPVGLVNILGSTFLDNSSIECLILPKSVNNINASTVTRSTYRLKYLIFSNSIETIPANFIATASNLELLIISDGVKAVAGTLGSNNALKKLILGKGLTSIGASAFAANSTLLDIRIYASIPPTLGNNAFLNSVSSITKIYVPDNSLNAYKSSWSAYTSYIYPLSEVE